MNRWVKIGSFVWLTTLGLLAAPLLDEPVPKLVLKDGSVLREARAKAFTTKVVMVKYDGGARTVAYELFPAEFQPVLAAKREAARAEQAKREATAQTQAPSAVRPAPARSITSGPEWREGCRLTFTGSKSNVATLILDNASNHVATLSPSQFVAKTNTGEVVPGVQWVGIDKDGRLAVTLNSKQTIEPGSSVTLWLALHLSPETPDNSVETVLWKDD